MKRRTMTNVLLAILAAEGLYITGKLGLLKLFKLRSDGDRWPPVKGGLLQFETKDHAMPDPSKCSSIEDLLGFMACAMNKHLEAYDQRFRNIQEKTQEAETR